MSPATLERPLVAALATPAPLRLGVQWFHRLPRLLLVIVLTLVALSTAGQIARHQLGHRELKGFVPAFYLDEEASVPTWYSSAALLLAAALLGLIAAAKFAARGPYRVHWAGLALLFALFSADEIAMFHEYPIAPLRATWDLGGPLYYGWVIPGAAFVAAVGLSYASFLRHLPGRTRNAFVLAGCVFVGGAIGVEMLSGSWADVHGENNLTYALIVTAEEFCEMLGVVLLIRAVVQYLPAVVPSVELRLAPAGTECAN